MRAVKVHLNYHHFQYFWVIATEGSIAAAASKLKLSQPTLSAQLKNLEDSLQTQLFERKNRRLVLTEAGKTAFMYAEDIFSLGDEFVGVIQGKNVENRLKLRIGVVDSFPKLLTYDILRPLYQLEEPVHVVCLEGKRKDLLSSLATHDLDIILTDAPLSSDFSVKAYSHPLGECPMIVVGQPDLVNRGKKDFPNCLRTLPVLLPTPGTMLRREIDLWLEKKDVSPNIVAEFDDSALMKVFASHGEGVAFLPANLEQEVKKTMGLEVLAPVEDLLERIFLVSLERKVKHPLVAAVYENARGQVFTE